MKRVDARYAGAWELPVLGAVAAPAAVLIRPDGHVAWAVGLPCNGRQELDALTTWFGSVLRERGLYRVTSRRIMGV